MNYKVFKKELESYQSLLDDLKRIDEQIKVLEYKFENVKAIQYDKQPGTMNESAIEEKRLEMIDRISSKMEDYQSVMRKIKAIDDDIALLSHDSQYICNLSKKGKSYEQIGKELGYSKVGIYLKIKSEVEKI